MDRVIGHEVGALVRVEHRVIFACELAWNQGVGAGGSSTGERYGLSSRERAPLGKASVKVPPMPIASPTDFICVRERLVRARELLEGEAWELDPAT